MVVSARVLALLIAIPTTDGFLTPSASLGLWPTRKATASFGLRPAAAALNRVLAPRMGGYGWIGDASGSEGSEERQLKLWGCEGTRTQMVCWFLHEMPGAKWQGMGAEGNPSPTGELPYLRDGAIEVFEPGAILLYLADEKFSAILSPRKKADAYKWLMWASAVFDFSTHYEQAADVQAAQSARLLTNGLAVLDRALTSGGGPFLSGDEFGVQDVAVASYLLVFPLAGVSLGGWPRVKEYLLACVRREACGKAFGVGEQERFVRALQG